jgi:hypothetical protein
MLRFREDKALLIPVSYSVRQRWQEKGYMLLCHIGLYKQHTGSQFALFTLFSKDGQVIGQIIGINDEEPVTLTDDQVTAYFPIVAEKLQIEQKPMPTKLVSSIEDESPIEYTIPE